VKAIKEQGFTKDDYYVFYSVGSMDYARENVDPSLRKLMQYPKYFDFGFKENNNISFGLSLYEYHNAACRNRCLYNALPIVLKKMQKSDEY
jgi:hypothetical protein